MAAATTAAIAGGVAAAGTSAAANKLLNKKKAPSIQEAARVNLLGQITPTGTLEFGTLGADGELQVDPNVVVARQTESPFLQNIRSGRERLAGALLQDIEQSGLLQLGALGSSNITPRTADEIRSILPSAQATKEGISPIVGAGDFGSEIQRLEDATFEGVKRRIDPEFRKRERRLIQSLADRGIPLTSEQGRDELKNLRLAESEALTRASLSAVGAGRAEQERLSRLGLATRGQQFAENRAQLSDALRKQLALSQLESAQRQQSLQERLVQSAERGQRIGELSSLAGGGLPTAPSGTGNVGSLALQAALSRPQSNIAGQVGQLAGLGIASGVESGAFDNLFGFGLNNGMFSQVPTPTFKPF